jgi:hypothetical protein
MLIYCAHKYGGKEENKNRAEMLVRTMQTTDTKNTYISPIHTFGYMYNDLSYDEGMELCLSLLDKCDTLYVLSDESEGVRREIDFALKNRKNIFFMKECIENA